MFPHSTAPLSPVHVGRPPRFPTARTICTLGSDHDGWLYKEACSALFLPAHPDKHAQSTRVTVQLNLATHHWADALVGHPPTHTHPTPHPLPLFPIAVITLMWILLSPDPQCNTNWIHLLLLFC